MLKYEMPFIHQSSFVRKDIYIYEKCGGYSQEYTICMDYDMMSRIRNNGGKFQHIDVTVSCFAYGGTSCKHPFRTIFEDLKIARIYGLTRKEYFLYAIKMCTKNFLKLILQKIRIYGILYKLRNKEKVIN